jgi:hypothetical protein
MLLQSLLRPVLTPIMRGIFDPAQSVVRRMVPPVPLARRHRHSGHVDQPRDLTSQWQDYPGTTPVATPGTVADSANPVGLALDIRAGATVLTDPGNHMLQSTSAARPLMIARVNLLTYTEDFSNASAYSYTWNLGLYRPEGTDAICDISIWHPQLELGSAATDYQSVLGNGYPYTSTGFPIAQKHDGVDDGMATAAFAAGTLINGMDCQIPVRRDSAASCVAGLYNGVADATKFFGMAESASGSGCVGSGAGTPTVWVDNTQLTGGTAVTRGTLHTALTVGDWHILEFRNLDLSTWTAAEFGLYTSYVFPGARGDILLYPSTASTEDKDAARQYLADYYGVTLP